MSTRSLSYGMKGEERKRLVKAVAEYRESISEYCGAPTFDYVVEDITIDKNGTLIFTSESEEDDVNGLTEYLASQGFRLPGETASFTEAWEELGRSHEEAERIESAMESAEEVEEIEEAPTAEPAIGLTVEVPKEGFTETALENLRKIVESKASLLKKVIGTEDLPIELTEDKIRFAWFPEPAGELETAAYTHLITAICEMAKTAKRVTAKDRPVESEKYAFRTWLLRLGFIGAEYKHERAILMKNLSGYAAFKNQAEADVFYEKLKVKKAAKKSATAVDAQTEEETMAEEPMVSGLGDSAENG